MELFMNIVRIVTGQLKQNTYFVASSTKNGVLIDSGDNAPAILQAVKDYTVPYIFLTHTHFDHILGLSEVQKATQAHVVVHERESDVVEYGTMNPPNFVQLTKELPKLSEVTRVRGGEEFQVGDLYIRLIATPGHTSGSMCILINDSLFSGDTLFEDAVGRTDLPTGDYEALMQSLRTIFKLPLDTRIYPGHGNFTTLAKRKRDFEMGKIH